METTAALDALIERGPLTVAFQPIVDLKRGEPLGHEVLGRCGAILGPLAEVARSPSALLEVAHRHGRLLPLDRRWREIAIARIARRGVDEGMFFLNVDPRVVEDPAYTPGYTLALVERHRLSPARFALELTEVFSRDPAEIERVLNHYRRQGFRVALDDLGAGQQSLVALIRLSPDIVKIDRELIRGVDTDRTQANLLRALAEFARRTNILLVAEGIETAGELRVVCEAGVPLGQGYLLGRPAPAPEGLSRDVVTRIRAEHHRGLPVAIRASDPSQALAQLVDGLQASTSLDPMLALLTDCAATLLGVERVSLRLLDEDRTRLLLAARTGSAIHGSGGAEFAIGEGFVGWVAKHGMALRVDQAEADPRFVARPHSRAAIGSFLGVPLLDSLGAIGVLAATSPHSEAFSTVDERWLKIVAGAAAPYIEVARLLRLSITDPLTSALNRRALDEVLPVSAEGEPLSVIAVDIDRFKALNDRLGHAAGDEALRAVVQIMGSALRRTDRVVRLGGDEFLLVLPGVSLSGACAVAARVRALVSTTLVLPGAEITISAGVAERTPTEATELLLQRADEALYRAKSLGRDRVESDQASAS
jgi:diguanylate cyclase (GGDEF)-like protein